MFRDQDYPGLEALAALYAQLGIDSNSTAQNLGMSCPSTCGACCNKPSSAIEVSVFEMLPLAFHAWRAGTIQDLMERAQSAGAENPCVLFAPGPQAWEGRCTQYSFRALTCRMFGYAGWRNKLGQIKFTACSRLKDHEAQAQGLDWPLYSTWRSLVEGLDPLRASELLPMNEAILRACQTVLMRKGYSDDPNQDPDLDKPDPHNDPGHDPVTPLSA